MINNNGQVIKAFDESSIADEQIIFLDYRTHNRESFEAFLAEELLKALHGD